MKYTNSNKLNILRLFNSNYLHNSLSLYTFTQHNTTQHNTTQHNTTQHNFN